MSDPATSPNDQGQHARSRMGRCQPVRKLASLGCCHSTVVRHRRPPAWHRTPPEARALGDGVIARVGSTIGFQAARLLHRLMRGGAPPKTPLAIAPLSIVQRQSTDTLAIPDPVLARALAFIRQQANLRVGVNEVARHAGVSQRGLERRFTEQLQRTPATELRRHQLDRARQLLADTDLPMSQVAEQAGFGSQAYFAAVFRAQCGQSPRQFRRAARGLD